MPGVEKGWRGDLRTNAVLPSNIARIIYIDLCKCQFTGLTMRRGELLEDGSYCFAGTAPIRVEVSNDIGI